MQHVGLSTSTFIRQAIYLLGASIFLILSHHTSPTPNTSAGCRDATTRRENTTGGSAPGLILGRDRRCVSVRTSACSEHAPARMLSAYFDCNIMHVCYFLSLYQGPRQLGAQRTTPIEHRSSNCLARNPDAKRGLCAEETTSSCPRVALSFLSLTAQSHHRPRNLAYVK